MRVPGEGAQVKGAQGGAWGARPPGLLCGGDGRERTSPAVEVDRACSCPVRVWQCPRPHVGGDSEQR